MFTFKFEDKKGMFHEFKRITEVVLHKNGKQQVLTGDELLTYGFCARLAETLQLRSERENITMALAGVSMVHVTKEESGVGDSTFTVPMEDIFTVLQPKKTK